VAPIVAPTGTTGSGAGRGREDTDDQGQYDTDGTGDHDDDGTPSMVVTRPRVASLCRLGGSRARVTTAPPPWVNVAGNHFVTKHVQLMAGASSFGAPSKIPSKIPCCPSAMRHPRSAMHSHRCARLGEWVLEGRRAYILRVTRLSVPGAIGIGVVSPGMSKRERDRKIGRQREREIERL
jgi:hypothetical protein